MAAHSPMRVARGVGVDEPAALRVQETGSPIGAQQPKADLDEKALVALIRETAKTSLMA